ncbi:LPXTG cell wall anchor domain-containing protein [Streptomyces sp. NPDC059788]|uniref:LPXTG cell wall anchor domain-containing protein n=1 Tax=Streptomyces sp. NPDC059788 TaxID=3346948 RepID=UPI00366A3735
MNDTRTAASSPAPAASYAPSRDAGRGARNRVRSAVTAGLLVAFALPAIGLAGTAHAEEPAVKAQSPSAAPKEPGAPATDRKPAPAPTNPSSHSRQSAEPSAAPSAAPSSAPGRDGAAKPAPAHGREDAAKPAPAPAKDELAKTGASTTTNVAMGAGAVLLIAGGGGAMYAARRRNSAG